MTPGSSSRPAHRQGRARDDDFIRVSKPVARELRRVRSTRGFRSMSALLAHAIKRAESIPGFWEIET